MIHERIAIVLASPQGFEMNHRLSYGKWRKSIAGPFEAESKQNLTRSQLERAVNETTQAFRDAKADSENNCLSRRFDEVLASMNIRGVSGRLSELCEPTQDRYKVAVEVPFDNVMDAVVVDKKHIAVEFILYLKERQGGVATPIPVANIRPWPVDQIFRRIGETARLVIDVATHDEEHTPAVLYASGSVVCNTLDEARRELGKSSGTIHRRCVCCRTACRRPGWWWSLWFSSVSFGFHCVASRPDANE